MAKRLRDPQLLAYLLAEHGRNVQALANVSLTRGRATFSRQGVAQRAVAGREGPADPNKVAAEEIDAAWQAELERWLQRLQIDWPPPISRARRRCSRRADVCRNCHLTVLCRRVELAAADRIAEDDA